jgi:hypothetical protein
MGSLVSFSGIFRYVDVFSPVTYSVEEWLKMANVDESVANLDVCGRFCGSCPTYAANNLKSGKPSLLFCGRGGAARVPGLTKEGCNCPKCGVHTRYRLTGDYYCMK